MRPCPLTCVRAYNRVLVTSQFRAWDADNDRHVSKVEFRAAFEQLGVGSEYADAVNGLFDSFDRDRSGQIEFNTTERGWETSVGTTPAGSTWRKNPIPSGLWQRGATT